MQQAYKTHKTRTGASADYFNIFADHTPIADLGDHRLSMNKEVLDYLKRWELDASQHQELSKTDRGKRLLSLLRFDLVSMTAGFHEVYNIAFQRFPGSTISPFSSNKQ